jgi:large subunit ribosomal protein L6
MSVEVDKDYVIIKNFAGERGVRKAKIMPGAKVEVIKKGSDIDVIVKGIDKDAVGQTAANIYLATKVKNKDPRVFLDGIYVYYKGVGMG